MPESPDRRPARAAGAKPASGVRAGKPAAGKTWAGKSAAASPRSARPAAGKSAAAGKNPGKAWPARPAAGKGFDRAAADRGTSAGSGLGCCRGCWPCGRVLALGVLALAGLLPGRMVPGPATVRRRVMRTQLHEELSVAPLIAPPLSVGLRRARGRRPARRRVLLNAVLRLAARGRRPARRRVQLNAVLPLAARGRRRLHRRAPTANNSDRCGSRDSGGLNQSTGRATC